MQHALVGLVAACAMGASLASWAADPLPRPVIEETWISAPQMLSGYTLLKVTNYAEQGDPRGGIGLRYHDALLPMTADLFIYPVGAGETLDHAEQEFRAGVDLAVERGLYSNVRWTDSAPYDLPQRGGSIWNGRVLSMQLKLKSGESTSRTYLFHHGLYDYKLRLDIGAQLADQLPRAGDALVRTVLPAVQVVSVGSCGRNLDIHVLEDGDAMPRDFIDGVAEDGFAIALHKRDLDAGASAPAADVLKSPLVALTLVAAQRQAAGGCTTFPYEPPHDPAMNSTKLHFPPGFWQSGPPAH